MIVIHEQDTHAALAISESSELIPSKFEIWIEEAERLSGFCLDGDLLEDGYCYDEAYKSCKSGKSPYDYVLCIYKKKLVANNPSKAGELATDKFIFGKFSRFSWAQIHSRFHNEVQFYIWDAEKLDESLNPTIIRQFFTLADLQTFIRTTGSLT